MTGAWLKIAGMAYFLAKTDPETYSYDDLEREKDAVWDGVSNPQALRAIRSMQPGDRVFMYHSGARPAVVGMAKVSQAPRPDPKNAKLTVVNLSAAGRLSSPTTLEEIKRSGLFGDFVLVRQPRLSTMAVPDSFVDWMKGRYSDADI
jgi:predicted RNA-binding protein with PUA-like domain